MLNETTGTFNGARPHLSQTFTDHESDNVNTRSYQHSQLLKYSSLFNLIYCSF